MWWIAGLSVGIGSLLPKSLMLSTVELLPASKKGLFCHIDLATHREQCRASQEVVGDVGKAGVSICSVEDMKVLFDGFLWTRCRYLWLWMVQFYQFLHSSRQLVLSKVLNWKRWLVQSKMIFLKSFMVRNTYIYPPEFSMRIIGDIFSYTAKNMPKFNSISISGYHMQRQVLLVISKWHITSWRSWV